MSDSKPQDKTSFQDTLSQLLSDDCPVLTSRLKKLFRQWSSDLENEIVRSESAAGFFQAIEKLCEEFLTVDLNDASSKDALVNLGISLDEVFRDTIAISVPAIKKIFRHRARRGSTAISWEKASSQRGNILECANEAKFLLRQVGSLRGKNVDNVRKLWQRGGINVKKGDKALPHENPPFQTLSAEEIYSVFLDPEAEITTQEEALRIADLQGGKKGPDTNDKLYNGWIAAAFGVVDDWTSGALDDDDAFFVGRRIQRLGIGGGNVLDWNRRHDEDRKEEWNTIHDQFENAYRNLCILFGATALTASDRQAGKSVPIEKRGIYFEQARYYTENSIGSRTNDFS